MNTRGGGKAAAAPAGAPGTLVAPKRGGGLLKKRAKGKAGNAVKVNVGSFPAWTGGDLDVLHDESVFEIFSFLPPSSAALLSSCNKSMLALMTKSTQFDKLWREMLYSKAVDAFGEYAGKVPAERRAKIEAHFSCKRVVSALLSNTCSACGEYAENFDINSCSRACRKCWGCPEAGAKGNIQGCKFGLCAISYAKTHYLLSDKEIKSSLFCLDINDETKAHGLMNAKMTLVLESEALRLAEEKFGSKEALAQEKSARASKAKDSYDLRCEDALSEGKKLPAEPDSVKKERAKDNPTHWNFISVNQSYISGRPAVAAEYGFIYSLYVKVALTQLPSVFVTRDTPAEIMEKHPHVTQALIDSGEIKISLNIIDAIYNCKNGHTLLVDMPCHIPTMAMTVDPASGAHLLAAEGMTVAGQHQLHCINLLKDIKIMGTPRVRITSHRAVFWTYPGAAVHLEGLTMSVNGGVYTNAPVLVLAGHTVINNCALSVASDGYCLLAHGQSTKVTGSRISSLGSPLAVHLTGLEHNVFKNNTISSMSDGDSDAGFYYDVPRGEGGVLLPASYTPAEEQVFSAQVQKNNHFVSIYHGDY